MITIGKIPKKMPRFFTPLKSHFTQKAWGHFWPVVLAITISHGCTIERLAKALRGSTHRTNHGEFLWRSCWNESQVMQNIALDMLRSLFCKHDRNIFFVIDDTQTLQRGRKMHGIGRLHHHATGKYGFGHTIVKVCLHYRGVTIPWGSWLYVKKEHAKPLDIPSHKLTDLAAQAIRQACLPAMLKVTVLFDAFYLCPTVVHACKEKGWHYMGVGKSNRWFTVSSAKRKLGRYSKNVLRNSGRWYTIKACRAQRQNKNKRLLRLEPVSKLKDRMRQIVWQENVQDVIKHSHEKPIIRRLEKLLAA